MHCRLILSTSAEVDRVLLFHFLALVSFISPKECIFLSLRAHWHLHIIQTFLCHAGAFGFDKSS